MSSVVETSLIVPKDLIGSLSVHSASGLSVRFAAPPAAPFSTALGMTKNVSAIARWCFMITYPAVKQLAAWVFLGILVSHASFAGDCNGLILEQIKEMPQGG